MYASRPSVASLARRVDAFPPASMPGWAPGELPEGVIRLGAIATEWVDADAERRSTLEAGARAELFRMGDFDADPADILDFCAALAHSGDLPPELRS